MLEYAVLSTFAFILAFFTLWFIRTAKTLGKTLYNAFLPSSKSDLKKPITDDDLPSLSGDLQFLSMPWGWRESPYRNREVMQQTKASSQSAPKPWGWPGGNNAEFRNVHFGVLRQLGDKIRHEASSHELPFARNRNVVDLGSIKMQTYFSDDSDMLHFPKSEPEKDRGFQLPWGW